MYECLWVCVYDVYVCFSVGLFVYAVYVCVYVGLFVYDVYVCLSSVYFIPIAVLP